MAPGLVDAVWISFLLSVSGLFIGWIMATLLTPLSVKPAGGIVGQAVALGLKSVPAFIFPLMFGAILGPGILMKIFVSGLICFFPILVQNLEGLSRVPEGLERISDVYGAGRWSRFRYIRFPWLVAGSLEGLKSAAPLAVVGALVAEFVDAGSGYSGLGLLFATNRNHVPTLYSLCVAATVLGIVLYFLVWLAKWWIDRRYRLAK